jgi:hypothetical protein
MSLGGLTTFCCSRRIFQRASINQNDGWNLAAYALLTNSDGNHAYRSFLCYGSSEKNPCSWSLRARGEPAEVRKGICSKPLG